MSEQHTHQAGSVIQDLRFPDVSDIKSALHNNIEEGYIWLGENRMLLMHAGAFGALRQELLELLGAEQTRGLITRLGYLSGSQDAELALKLRSSADQLSLVAAGAQLRSMCGAIQLDPKEMEVDANGQFKRGEFTWKHSIESEAHTTVTQGDYRSVCWMEVGYSSAFLTRLMGRPIMVKEVECRAAGGETCRAIAKPLQDWEDGEEDARYFRPQVRKHSNTKPHPQQKQEDDNLEADLIATLDTPNSNLSEAGVGRSIAFHTAMHKALRVAETDATVLLLGESGVGKTLFAKEIHKNSRRADAPFIEVNCAAIPEQLLESELFGVQKGAFSGALQSRPGRFEAANGGTLFLDEIGTLSMTAQSKLLRVLQSGELERLGSNETIKADVRLVAATNEELAERVNSGEFRSDLYYRINVFPIVIAPLRERKEDIPLLLEQKVNQLSQTHNRSLRGVAPPALQKLLDYDWPGNVREFENIVERAVILADNGDRIDTHHIGGIDAHRLDTSKRTLSWDSAPSIGIVTENATELSAQTEDFADAIKTLAEKHLKLGTLDINQIEQTLVDTAMRLCKGNVTRAAARLGMTRSQLDYRLKKLKAETTS